MTDNGWRTVLIESKSELSVSEECLVIKSEGQTREAVQKIYEISEIIGIYSLAGICLCKIAEKR